MIRYKENNEKAPLTKKTSEGILIHEKADDMPNLPVGRFTRFTEDDRIFALACEFPAVDNAGVVYVSADNGETWERTEEFSSELELFPTDSGAFMCTDKGTLIAAFSDRAGIVKETEWDAESKDGLGWQLPTYVVRSLDGGKSWQDLQKLHDEWTGANRDMIQTRDGKIIFTTMKLLHNPGRHSVMTYCSDDDGLTWTPSNIIDLGGNGHHDGVTEATLVELKDGRLLKYIRTNWGQLWRAFSSDGGRSWHPHGPAGIDASSTPAFLQRLESGRIVMLWNRQFPEGESSYQLRGGDGVWSATPASNFRGELSISFSEDECETWSPPVVIARNEGEVCYPYAFEYEPGVLWITAHRFKLKMRLNEDDFLR